MQTICRRTGSGLWSPGSNNSTMHNPERDPFYEGLWADIREGIEASERGEVFDGEDVFRELLGGTVFLE